MLIAAASHRRCFRIIDFLYLVGDAATTAKPTTAGGIIQGLIGAEALSDSLLNNKNYQREWKKRMGKDLYISLLIRKMMDRFSEKDYNFMIMTDSVK